MVQEEQPISVQSEPVVQEQKQTQVETPVESVPAVQEQQRIPSLSNQKQDASSLGLLSKIKKFLPYNPLSQNGGEKKQIFIKTDVPKYNEEKLKETDNIKIIRIKKEHLIPRI